MNENLESGIPNGFIRFENLTRVPLPEQLDMRKSEAVIDLIRKLVEEEICLNPYYYGLIVYGSLSRNTAHNKSDIDLIHVVEDMWDSDQLRIRARLKTIFESLYGCYRVDQYRNTIGLKQMREDPDYCKEEDAKTLSQDSVVIIPNKKIRKEVEKTLGFKKKEPYSDRRLHKPRTKPHRTPLKLRLPLRPLNPHN